MRKAVSRVPRLFTVKIFDYVCTLLYHIGVFRYFPIDATKEILAELLPQINPWSTDTHVVCQLATFLPVALNPEYENFGHLLWFDDMMTLWDTCYNSQCGISVILPM